MSSRAGYFHHVEVYVRDLARSREFYAWLLGELGGEVSQEWDAGVSLRKGDAYLVLVQAEDAHLEAGYHRKRVGLNHLAFHASGRAQVDALREGCRARGAPELYPTRYPFAGGPGYYALFVEDPDRIKVEVVAPEGGDVSYEVHEEIPEGDLLDEVCGLHDQIFGPDRDLAAELPHRLAGRAVRLDLARDEDGAAVGFKLGYEDRPRRFLSWLGGVVERRRGRGIAGELMRRQHAGLAAAGYAEVRTNTFQRWLAMLRLDLAHGFEVLGTEAHRSGKPKLLLAKRLDPPG